MSSFLHSSPGKKGKGESNKTPGQVPRWQVFRLHPLMSWKMRGLAPVACVVSLLDMSAAVAVMYSSRTLHTASCAECCLMIFASCYSLEPLHTEYTVRFCRTQQLGGCAHAGGTRDLGGIEERPTRAIVDACLIYSFIHLFPYSFIHSFAKHALSPVCLDLCSPQENKDKKGIEGPAWWCSG